jgi:hypothetical protein
MIVPIEGLPNVLAKTVLGGESYYRVVEVSRIDKIKQYLWSLRNTPWEKQVKGFLTSSSFLEGVSGTPLVFTVSDFWRGEIAPTEMKGTWIHKSILFPFVIMSSTSGLFYMVKRFNTFLDENLKLKNDLTAMSMEIVKKNDYIKELEASIDTRNYPSPEQLQLYMPEIEKVKVVHLHKSKKYPLRIINKAMKKAKVKFGKRGPTGKEAKREYIYSELILDYLMFCGIIRKRDQYNYVLGKETQVLTPKFYAYVYIPHRQDNRKGNENTNLPVQYAGLTRNGVNTILESMTKAKIIEKVDVNYR